MKWIANTFNDFDKIMPINAAGIDCFKYIGTRKYLFSTIICDIGHLYLVTTARSNQCFTALIRIILIKVVNRIHDLLHTRSKRAGCSESLPFIEIALHTS